MSLSTWIRPALSVGAFAFITLASVALAQQQQQQERLPGNDQSDARPQPRFQAYDVFIDAGDANLGAYQIEILAPDAGVVFAGVEGGDHPSFRDPPFYDPRALQDGERIVLAAFSTADDLPTGRTRIARLHVQEMPRPNDAPVDWVASVIVAGDDAGAQIETTAIEVTRSNAPAMRGFVR